MNNMHNMFVRLNNAGGAEQQDRMIKDKLKSLNKAIYSSYQGAKIQLLTTNTFADALINPDHLTMDYDEKILSIDFAYGTQAGDVIRWINPNNQTLNSYWLIYLQDLTELAYFKGSMRQCQYQIRINDNGNEHSVYASIIGPKEKNITNVFKSEVSMDLPSQSITLMVPNTKIAKDYFQRYAKFYLHDCLDEKNAVKLNTCWRVENIDSLSLRNVLIIYAREYYNDQSNILLDNEENDTPSVSPNIVANNSIVGDTYIIKPMLSYLFRYNGDTPGVWKINANSHQIKNNIQLHNNINTPYEVTVSWDAPYGNEEFELIYETKEFTVSQIITVVSMY